MYKVKRKVVFAIALIVVMGITPFKAEGMTEIVPSSTSIEKIEFAIEDKVEQEPNDYMDKATGINLNSSYTGKMNSDMDMDMDYFKFTLDEPKEVNIKVQHDKFNIEDSTYWYVTLCDEYLHEIDQLEIKGKDTVKILKRELKKGTYFIKVYSSNEGNSINKLYNLGVFETSDWMNHWGTDTIGEAMDKGWVDKTTVFRPNDSITRAEFIKVVNKAFDYEESMEITYTDVPKNAWFYNEVSIAAKEGYITTANSTFRPNDPISREEVAVIVTSIMKNKDSNFDKLNKYTDRNKVSSWAKTSVEGAIEAAYMGSGSLEFRPLDKITRAEAVTTLSRIK